MDMFSVQPFRRWASLPLWLLYLLILFGSSSSSSSSSSHMTVLSASVGPLRTFDGMDGSERLVAESRFSPSVCASSSSSSEEEEGAWSSPACPLSLLLNPVEPKAAPYKRKHESSHSDRSEQERPAPPVRDSLAYEAGGHQSWANSQPRDTDKSAMAPSRTLKADGLGGHAVIESDQGSSRRFENSFADQNGYAQPSVLSQVTKKDVMRKDAETIEGIKRSMRAPTISYDREGRLQIQSIPVYSLDRRNWTCPSAACDYSNQHYTNVRKHIVSVHPRAICDLCDKVVKWGYLAAHLQRHVHYYEVKEKQCRACRVGFWLWEDLQAHLDLPYHEQKLIEARARDPNGAFRM